MPRVPRRFLFLTARPIAADLADTLVLYLLTGSARLTAAIGLEPGMTPLAGYFARRRRPPALLVTGVSLTAIFGGVTIAAARAGAALRPADRDLELPPARTLDRIGWCWWRRCHPACPAPSWCWAASRRSCPLRRAVRHARRRARQYSRADRQG